jgi:LAGLIDADG endonuclease
VVAPVTDRTGATPLCGASTLGCTVGGVNGLQQCATCHGPIGERRATARFCSEVCRGRATSRRYRGVAEGDQAVEIPTVEVPDAFGNWLAGFLDGEACFVIEKRTSACYSTRLSLVLRHDDAAIIAEIAATTGLGSIELKNSPSLDGRPQIGWHVRTKADCAALVNLLDRYPLRAKKARDYAIWREAVGYWVASSRIARSSAKQTTWPLMADCLARLRAVRSYGDTP